LSFEIFYRQRSNNSMVMRGDGANPHHPLRRRI